MEAGVGNVLDYGAGCCFGTGVIDAFEIGIGTVRAVRGIDGAGVVLDVRDPGGVVISIWRPLGETVYVVGAFALGAAELAVRPSPCGLIARGLAACGADVASFSRSMAS